MKVLLIQNNELESFDLYEVYLKENDIKYQVFHAYRMDEETTFPPATDFDSFILGSTPISSNDFKQHTFMRKEWEYLANIIDSKKSCLGICCGAQLLTKRLGAEVKRSPELEVGSYNIQLTQYGMDDPLFFGFPKIFPVFQWHGDMFEIPPEGQLLATGDVCPIQAFAWKNIRGILFHLETSWRKTKLWADAYPDELKAVGKTTTQLADECRTNEHQMSILAYKLMDNFLAL